MSSPPKTASVKNELEEAFLRRFLTDTKLTGPRDGRQATAKPNHGVAEKKAARSGEAALIHMRCAQYPRTLIQWREVNETHEVGVAQKFRGTLERVEVKPRVVQWVVRLLLTPLLPSSLHDAVVEAEPVACTVNGFPVNERDIALRLGDVVTWNAAVGASASVGSGHGGEMWLVEAGPAYQVVASDEGIMPCVVSTSPFVVAEAAANSEFFAHIEAQVKLLEDRVAVCADALGEKTTASKRFSPEATDAPQLRLHRRLEWCMTTLERLDQHARRVKRTDKEVQTTLSGGARGALPPTQLQHHHPMPCASRFSWTATAAGDAGSRAGHAPLVPSATVTASSGGVCTGHDVADVAGTQAAVALKAALHQLWVSEVRYRAIARIGEASDTAAAQVASALSERVEHLLHVNAELQRRLNQRSWQLHKLEDEVRQLRAACVNTEGPLEMQASVDELKQLLLSAVSQPSTTAAEPRRLSAAEESTLWRCVANTLHYVTSLENSLRRANLEVDEAVRRGHGPHQRVVDELRDEISALRAEGSVDAIAALHQTLRFLMIEFGGAGHSTMSAWT